MKTANGNGRTEPKPSTIMTIMMIVFIVCMGITVIGYIDTREPRLLAFILAFFVPCLLMWLKIPSRFRRKETQNFLEHERLTKDESDGGINHESR